MAIQGYKWTLVLLLPLLMGTTPRPATEPAWHPFYVSVTEINQNAAEKSLEISCKFFMDDLEATLEKSYKTTLDITVDKYKPSFDKYIADYIPKHFSITIDGKPVVLKYVGYETEKESAYAYFEVDNVTAAKSVQVMNNMLYDFSPQQFNIMHCTIGGKRQSTKLNQPDSKAAFSF